MLDDGTEKALQRAGQEIVSGYRLLADLSPSELTADLRQVAAQAAKAVRELSQLGVLPFVSMFDDH
jgi:hypothetical protein